MLQTRQIKGLEAPVTRVGLGTSSMADNLPGTAGEAEAVATIRSALERGVNLLDTAPLYGEGRAEEVVGKALREHGRREDVVIATKCGLEWWREGGETKVRRNSGFLRLRTEVEDSLRRLGTDYLDIYLVHWHDPGTPIEQTAAALRGLLERGLVRALGVSNFSVEQMEAFRSEAPLAVVEPPYNLFEREAEADVLPYARKHGVATLTYSVLSRGLLTGKMPPDLDVSGDPRRENDPKFHQPLYWRHLEAVDTLDRFSRERYGRPVIELALRWALDKGADVPLWGARRPSQLEPIDGVWEWRLDDAALEAIDRILEENIDEHPGTAFMAPD